MPRGVIPFQKDAIRFSQRTGDIPESTGHNPFKGKWKTALVYLDDVIIYSRTVEEHLTHVRTVLDLLKEAGVTLKLRKCEFFGRSVDYLGHTISPGRL